MDSGDRPGAAPEDVRLFRLKRGLGGGELSARRTLFTVLSGVLVMAAGGLLIAGAVVPWLIIAGESVAPIREGGPDGAAATWCAVVGGVWVLLGLVAAIGRRRAPRFLHFLTWLLGPLTYALVQYRAHILGQLVFVHNTDLRREGLAVAGAGIHIVYAGLALGVVAPLLSFRQALRVMRS
jgi:hypothetical protein